MSNPFITTPRKEFTRQFRAKFCLARGGVCANCTSKVRGKTWEIDHIVSLENGGTNDESNLQLLCAGCHKLKTSNDRMRAAKSRAQTISDIVPTIYRRKGPPMPGSKRSPWKRKMNGTWERR